MRRNLALFLILIVALSLVVSCGNRKLNKVQNKTEKTESDIREIAYNALGETYKQQVIDWKNAKVEEVILNGNAIGSSIGKYYTSYAYKVSFRNSREGVLGPIFVYLDKNSYRFIGIGLRD